MADSGVRVRSMGELAALGELFQEHRARLLAVIRRRMSPALARRVDPEDVLNDAYLKLHQRGAGPATAMYREPSARLLYLAAQDCLKDAWRFHSRRGRDIGREVPWPERASRELGSKLAMSLTSPTEAVRRKDVVQSIRAALEGLDPIDREILELRYLDRMNYAEIAEYLDITRDAAMKRHSRALRRIDLDHLDPDAVQ